MILLIDDLRSWDEAVAIAQERYPSAHEVNFKDGGLIARDLDEAIDLLSGSFHFDVLLVDHDLGRDDSDGADALKILLERCLTTKRHIPDHVFAVSSNPAGIKKINGYAKDFKKLKGLIENGKI